jgi:hypothetical protein
MALTPARLAAAANKTAARVPKRNRADKAPTLAAVLASMTPETRRYMQKVISLTFAQLAAGATGSP